MVLESPSSRVWLGKLNWKTPPPRAKEEHATRASGEGREGLVSTQADQAGLENS